MMAANKEDGEDVYLSVILKKAQPNCQLLPTQQSLN